MVAVPGAAPIAAGRRRQPMPAKAMTNATPDRIDRVLAGPLRWLRFPPALEARFEADTGRARCRHLALTSVFGVAAYELSLFSDHALVPDAFNAALAFKLGLVVPFLAVALSLMLYREPWPWLREALATALGCLAAVGVVFVARQSESPLAVHALYGALLAPVFITLIVRVRFWYALASSLVLTALFAYGTAQMGAVSPHVYIGALMMMIVLCASTLVSNYDLERSERAAYLTALRGRARTELLVRANEELSRISQLDSITGLTNRRGFDEHLPLVWERVCQAGQSVAMLMLDIDHFKRFNDSNGHQAGDACLKDVAQAARSTLRGDDGFFARFGGEEFVAVLPGADLLDGIRAAERMRRAVETMGTVTVSIGIAAAPASDKGTPDEILQAADAALYEAKRRGRNRVWPPIISAEPDLMAATLVPGQSASGEKVDAA